MNHLRHVRVQSSGTVPNICRLEQSLALSDANLQTQSKDPYRAGEAIASEETFRVVVRFFDDEGSKERPVSAGQRQFSEQKANESRRDGRSNTSNY